MRHEVNVGGEQRRCWSEEQKLGGLREVGTAGAAFADVARRRDLIRQPIYQWRRELRWKGIWPCSEGTEFLPAEHAAEEPSQASDVGSGRALLFETLLGNDRTLRCHGKIEDDDLVRLIRLVEAA